ncbi:MAG: hypothetical protein M0Q37_08835 [Sphaerochaeta sp.]|nr:hypothetical protein [Sphaerochaeta sp.]
MHRTPTVRSLALVIILLASTLLPLLATSLVIGTGNDWITMGFGNNEDDGHSFAVSAHATVDNGLSLLFDLDGYTDQREVDLRYSTLSLSLSYPFTYRPHPSLELSLSPLVGAHLAGDLGLQTLQNLLHRILGRDEVFLGEAYDGVKGMVLLGASTQAAVTLGSHRVGARVEAATVPLWESQGDLSLFWQGWDLIRAGIGYHARFDHDHHPVRTLELTQNRGLYLFSTYHTPLLHTAWTIWPETGFSWGSFGFDVLAFGQPKRFVEADLSTVNGIYYDTAGYQTRVSALLYKGFLVQVHYSNGPTAKGAAFRRNIGTWSVGWQWEPANPSALLRPSLSVLAGVKRLNLVENYSTVRIDALRAVAGVEAGVGLGRKDGWVVGNSAYHFRFGVAVHYTFASTSLSAPALHWDQINRPLTLLFGLALQIDHDFDAL